MILSNCYHLFKKSICQLRNFANGLFAETKSLDGTENLNGTECKKTDGFLKNRMQDFLLMRNQNADGHFS
jgi:hypothetical protein